MQHTQIFQNFYAYKPDPKPLELEQYCRKYGIYCRIKSHRTEAHLYNLDVRISSKIPKDIRTKVMFEIANLVSERQENDNI